MKALWYPSASSSARSLACPASVALPKEKAPESTVDQLKGSLLHYFLEKALISTVDWDEAKKKFSALEDEDFESVRQTCLQIDFGDIIREGTHYAEPAYAYHPETSTARLLGFGIERQYLQAGWRPTEEIPGSADLVIDSPTDGLCVVDYKTAHYDNQHSYSWLPQLKTLALMAARCYGRDNVSIAVCLIRDDGRVQWTMQQTLDAIDLDAHAEELRIAVARWKEARELIEKGEAPPTQTGPYCKECLSRTVCPSWTLLARQFASGATGLDPSKISSLSPKEAGAAWEKFKLLEGILVEVEKQLRDKARHQPLQLSNGVQMGMVECTKEDFNKEALASLIRTTYGQERLFRAGEWKITKASLIEELGKDNALSLLEELRRQGKVKNRPYFQLRALPAKEEK